MSSTNTTTTKALTRAKVLLTGLVVEVDLPDYFRQLFGTPSEIDAKIAADTQRIRDYGYDVTQYFVNDQDPQRSLDWMTSIEQLRGAELMTWTQGKLRSEKFKGIMIGSGLRLIPPQTELFEAVVNVCRRESPDSLLMFNYGPGTNFETLARNADKLE